MTRRQQRNRKKPRPGRGKRWGEAVSSRLGSRKISRKNSRLAHLLESSAVISGHSRIVELSLLTWIMPSIIFRALGFRRGFPREVDESWKHRRAKTSPPPSPRPSTRTEFRASRFRNDDSGVEDRDNEPLTKRKNVKRAGFQSNPVQSSSKYIRYFLV